jgi:hypothetical protein
MHLLCVNFAENDGYMLSLLFHAMHSMLMLLFDKVLEACDAKR